MFDLDGTLVDTASLYLEGVPRVVRKHLGVDISPDDYLDLWGRDVRDWFTRAAGAGGAALVDTMYADFEDYYFATHRRCPVYDGVAEGMALLKRDGARIGIVTTRPQRRAELARELPFASHLDFIVGGDRVARRKPAPDSLDFAIERYAPTRSPRGYVGDTVLDVQAAKAARRQVLAVAALWDCRDRNSIMAAAPHAAFENFTECAQWLASCA